jgi:DNA-binding NarL/FixJ family response regulator
MSSLRVFLVDDHDIVRAGMRAMLEDSFDIVGEAADVAGSISGILETSPDVVVLDVKLPGGGGSKVIEQVRHVQPGVRFIALTVSTSREDVAHMMQAGVDGYVTKGTVGDDLPDIVLQTAVGRKPVSADVAGYLLDIDEDVGTNPAINRLTPKEREVVNLIARGYTYRETAERLYITVKTLEKHMSSIFGKLSVASRHELAALAYEEGYVATSGDDRTDI